MKFFLFLIPSAVLAASGGGVSSTYVPSTPYTFNFMYATNTLDFMIRSGLTNGATVIVNNTFITNTTTGITNEQTGVTLTGTFLGNGYSLTDIQISNIVGSANTVTNTQTNILLGGTFTNSTFWGTGYGISNVIATNIHGGYVKSLAGAQGVITGPQALGLIGAQPTNFNLTTLATGNASSLTNLIPLVQATNVIYATLSGMTNDTPLSLLLSTNPASTGADQAAILQSLLDRATNGGIHLILDGRFTVSGVKIRSNTWLEALPGCGLLLPSGKNTPLLRNYNSTNSSITDANITISGGIFNFNGHKQVHDKAATAGWEGGFVVGMSFIGVNGVRIYDTHLLNPSTFSVYAAYVNDFYVDSVNIETGLASGVDADGLYFNGPASNIKILNSKAQTVGDPLVFNANDTINTTNVGGYTNFTPFYTIGGPITNVTVENFTTYGNSPSVFRLTSSSNIVDNVVFDGLHGTTTMRYGELFNYIDNTEAIECTNVMGPPGIGNFGNIKFKNVDVEITGGSESHYGFLDIRYSVVSNLVLEAFSRRIFLNNNLFGLLGTFNMYKSTITGVLNIKDWTLMSPDVYGQGQIVIDGTVGSLILCNNTFAVNTDGQPADGAPVWIQTNATISAYTVSGNLVASSFTNLVSYIATPPMSTMTIADHYGNGYNLTNLHIPDMYITNNQQGVGLNEAYLTNCYFYGGWFTDDYQNPPKPVFDVRGRTFYGNDAGVNYRRSIALTDRLLVDPNDLASIDWSQRILYGWDQTPLLSWSNGIACDGSQITNLNLSYTSTRSVTNSSATNQLISISNGKIQSIYATNRLYLTLAAADQSITENFRLNVLSTDPALVITWTTTNLIGASSLVVTGYQSSFIFDHADGTNDVWMGTKIR